MPKNPYPYKPLDATPEINLDIIDNPYVEWYFSLYHPELLPGCHIRNARPCHNQSLATVAISKSEDTSHAHDWRFPDTFLTAARSRPFLVRLADQVDATLSRLAMIEPFVWGDMQVPVPVPASATRPSGPSRTRTQTKRASPYPRGKDNSQIIGSRPSDVEHTVQSTTGGCSRRYLILSFPSPGTECDQDCRTHRNKGQETQPILGRYHLPRQRVRGALGVESIRDIPCLRTASTRCPPARTVQTTFVQALWRWEERKFDVGICILYLKLFNYHDCQM